MTGLPEKLASKLDQQRGEFDQTIRFWVKVFGGVISVLMLAFGSIMYCLYSDIRDLRQKIDEHQKEIFSLKVELKDYKKIKN